MVLTYVAEQTFVIHSLTWDMLKFNCCIGSLPQPLSNLYAIRYFHILSKLFYTYHAGQGCRNGFEHSNLSGRVRVSPSRILSNGLSFKSLTVQGGKTLHKYKVFFIIFSDQLQFCKQNQNFVSFLGQERLQIWHIFARNISINNLQMKGNSFYRIGPA